MKFSNLRRPSAMALFVATFGSLCGCSALTTPDFRLSSRDAGVSMRCKIILPAATDLTFYEGDVVYISYDLNATTSFGLFLDGAGGQNIASLFITRDNCEK